MDSKKKWMLGLLPLLLLAVVVVGLFMGIDKIIQRPDIPLEEITFDRVWLEKDHIKAQVTNTGTDPVKIAQVTVNGAIWNADIQPDPELSRLEEAQINIPYHWVEGEPYEITLVTETGAKFSGEVAAATEAPKPNASSFGLFALIGVLVGVIPVLLGLIWKPFVARLQGKGYTFILAVTAGLLLFLGVDSLEAALELAFELPEAYQGIGLLLLAGLGSFLILNGINEYAQTREQLGRKWSPRLTVAYLIAFGIGLHNLGEGLAIGAAFTLGEVAMGAFLIMGFTLHNITEGLAIVAPIAREQISSVRLLRHLFLLGLLGGSPAVLGTWIGGFLYSQIWSLVFLGIGAGAIFQVVVEVMKLARSEREETLFSLHGAAGLLTGILVMLVTAVFVSA
ncbi:ZIP family metal transporter [Polycladomyces abyssicola]|nr:ZIP family metal transporter [Polycladomyces abyssicola]